MPKADKGKPELSALVVGNADDMEQTANALERIAAEGDKAAEALLPPKEINTDNEFLLGLQGKVIRPLQYPEFTTKQQAYRFMAWLGHMSDMLPDETEAHTFPDIVQAVANT